ncbi:MAG: class I SAM-dependent methyltransferase [Planctomycetota bacterium]
MAQRGANENGYQLVDSGQQQKLERFGPYTLVRPSAQSVWPRHSDRGWDEADASFVRDATGNGEWHFRTSVPQHWTMDYAGVTWGLQRNDFGHVGIFPEQEPSWRWIREQVARCATAGAAAPDVLNLFGYTGGSTLCAAAAGAQVVHLDASKVSVRNASENARLSGLAERPVRWIVDDAVRFVDRELRRQRCYHGIVLDPPTYGRGTRGEIWKVEDDVLPLMEKCAALLQDRGKFLLLSSHSPGFTPFVLENLARVLPTGTITSGEMVMTDVAGRPLPSGAYARWERS